LKSIKEQLRHIPNRGLGYGLLLYCSGDVASAAKLRGLPQAEVSFNYLGQFDQILQETTLWIWAKAPSGPAHSPQGSRRYLLEVNGRITGSHLQLDWTYSENLHRRATIERLAQGFLVALRSLILHCQSPEAGGYTPSDFPDVELSQEGLEKILGAINFDSKQGS
jgi:non-ribosomal peptide synthase protein (TIGR01720 family)